MKAVISMREIMAKQIFTVKVKNVQEYRLRIWIGTKLFWLATKIMGMEVRIEKDYPNVGDGESLLPKIPKEQIPTT